ncbi:MAG: Flp pilus assembly complex ATPase component TadA, partial [Gemmatimonadetes bacterium]|nr:Flp pilus assembly complex ATPase component TadA [Gemmatimonadota bacterium]
MSTSLNRKQAMWSSAHLQSFVPDRNAVELVPRAVAVRYGIVPLRAGDGAITLGMRDPKDLEALDYVQMITQLQPSGVPVEDKLLREIIERVYGTGQNPQAEMTVERIAEKALKTATVGDDGAVEMPIVQLFDRLLEEAIRLGTTDLHIQPNEDDMAISFRVDGMMRQAYSLPAELAIPLSTRIKVVANLDISERRLPQDGKLSLFVGGKNVDLRVSTMLTLHGENVVIRILQQGAIRLGLEDLGFRPNDMEVLRLLFTKPHGIVLTTGPTGSGKTTTLYAALREIDCVNQNVMTLEDPVE